MNQSVGSVKSGLQLQPLQSESKSDLQDENRVIVAAQPSGYKNFKKWMVKVKNTFTSLMLVTKKLFFEARTMMVDWMFIVSIIIPLIYVLPCATDSTAVNNIFNHRVCYYYWEHLFVALAINGGIFMILYVVSANHQIGDILLKDASQKEKIPPNMIMFSVYHSIWGAYAVSQTFYVTREIIDYLILWRPDANGFLYPVIGGYIFTAINLFLNRGFGFGYKLSLCRCGNYDPFGLICDDVESDPTQEVATKVSDGCCSKFRDFLLDTASNSKGYLKSFPFRIKSLWFLLGSGRSKMVDLLSFVVVVSLSGILIASKSRPTRSTIIKDSTKCVACDVLVTIFGTLALYSFFCLTNYVIVATNERTLSKKEKGAQDQLCPILTDAYVKNIMWNSFIVGFLSAQVIMNLSRIFAQADKATVSWGLVILSTVTGLGWDMICLKTYEKLSVERSCLNVCQRTSKEAIILK